MHFVHKILTLVLALIWSDGNLLTGSIPSNIGSLRGLETLRLRKLSLEGCGSKGPAEKAD